MEHNLTLISTLAAGFGIALILGFVAERLKMPALVGYLLAGIIIGPSTPGFVADVDLAAQLAEIGVMLLMFGVGLHFSFGDLLAVRKIAVPGAVVQMSAATLLGMVVAHYWGWTWGESLVFGLSLSCASTVVLLKALEKQGVLNTTNGQIAVGWLVVEDLATVLVLVLLPPLASVLGSDQTATVSDSGELWMTIGWTLLQVFAFIAIMLVVGRRVMPWLLWQITRTGSRELFTLSVVAAAIGIAFGAAELFNVSFALGAFFAGMVMRESEFSHRAAEESLPLRDAFSVLFFVSVGMLFEPSILVDEPLHLLAVVAIVVLGKTLAAFLIVRAFRYPLDTALTVSASLAQIGEFSFILAGLGLALGILPTEGMNLILAAALVSIALNPVLFALNGAVQRLLENNSPTKAAGGQAAGPASTSRSEENARPSGEHVIIVSYGDVGREIAHTLAEQKIPLVVIEYDPDVAQSLREKGITTIAGDAGQTDVLTQANVSTAMMLVVATPDLLECREVIEAARGLNPNIEIVLRSHGAQASQMMLEESRGIVLFSAEQALAASISAHVVSHCQRR